MLKTRITISKSKPLDQPDLLKSVLKYVPLKKIFALASVAKLWASVADDASFHSQRLALNLWVNRKPKLRLLSHGLFEDWIATMEHIPPSKLPNIAKLVTEIRNFNLAVTVNLSPDLFLNVKTMRNTGPFGDNADFFRSFFDQIEGLYHNFGCQSLQGFVFPKLQWLHGFNYLEDLEPFQDSTKCRAMFPNLRLFFAHLDGGIQRGLENVDAFYLFWDQPHVDDVIAIDEDRMANAQAFVFHVRLYGDEDDDCWSQICHKVKHVLEISREFLHGKKIIFVKESKEVDQMIPENMTHIVVNEKSLRYGQNVLKDFDECLKRFS